MSSRPPVRARPAITGPRISRAMRSTLSKSPGEAMGKPASMTSTPSSASACAMRSFSSMFIEKPGLCSPSRSVVSKMMMRSAAIVPKLGCSMVMTVVSRRSGVRSVVLKPLRHGSRTRSSGARKSKKQAEPGRARAGGGQAVPRAEPGRGARNHAASLHRGRPLMQTKRSCADQLLSSKAPLRVRETSSPTRGTYLATPKSLRLNEPVAEKPTV